MAITNYCHKCVDVVVFIIVLFPFATRLKSRLIQWQLLEMIKLFGIRVYLKWIFFLCASSKKKTLSAKSTILMCLILCQSGC